MRSTLVDLFLQFWSSNDTERSLGGEEVTTQPIFGPTNKVFDEDYRLVRVFVNSKYSRDGGLGDTIS